MPYAKQNNKLNDLPLTCATYEELCKRCIFGEQPIGGKVVVKDLGPAYARHRYAIVSNPIGLDVEHIAFWADHGNMPFGFGYRGGIIEIYTD